ncbi:Chromate transporter [Methylocella silvestris BL2]|uniref:Chromate transporter n=1 Tax=Methylocella silvestris (strain DSM 15510 / CIP 108128 / LMG 27833 / NCIMB 13906 / BL2) TaxID=395965 RepID=B8EJC7_METSB|nr:chromate transporter [Methylocella silvestris]ACK52619.1 Chromate transporter [Methylocella silvestris BL2]
MTKAREADRSGAAGRASLPEIFLAFLVIGATSFGGGVVAYLRNALVIGRGWLDEEQFLSALEIAQALPGLNATNMSVIVGDRLRGPPGAALAFIGMTAPGAALVMTLGVLYASNAENPYVNAGLIGVGAAAVGMLSAVTFQIGRKQLRRPVDLAIILVTVAMVSFFHISLVIVLLTVGPLAVLIYRPRRGGGAQPPE